MSWAPLNCSSWAALQAFRDGWDPLKRSEDSCNWSQSIQRPVFVSIEEQASEIDILGALANSVAATKLTDDVVAALRPVTQLARTARRSEPRLHPQQLITALTRSCQCFEEILRHPTLPALDSQFCCGQVAFCLRLRHLINAQGKVTETKRDQHGFYGSLSELAVPSTSHLANIAQSFINKRLDHAFRSLQHKSCIAWSAIVLGSYLLHTVDNSLRTKGHIILISLRESIMMLCPLINTEFGWGALKNEVASSMDVLWHEDLEGMWEQDWHTTMGRQRTWEQNGLLKIGAPVADEAINDAKVDLVEYLVLREARDSLPRIEESQDAV